MSAGPVAWYLAEQQRIKRLKAEWRITKSQQRRNEIERQLEEIAESRWTAKKEGL